MKYKTGGKVATDKRKSKPVVQQQTNWPGYLYLLGGVIIAWLLLTIPVRGSFDPDSGWWDRIANTVMLRPIDDNRDLSAGHGPKGEKGDTGATGAQGPIGLAGATGAQGLIGPAGLTGSFSGSGASITDLNATNVTTGTLSSSRLNSSVTLQGNSFNGASQLVQTTSGGTLPAISGASLTALNATNISAGSLDDARLSSNVALLNRNSQVFTGNSQIFRNGSNSSTAFRVQDAASSSIFTVDTSASKVTISTLEATTGTIATLSATGSFTLGASGTALTQIRVFAATIDPSVVSAVTTSEQAFTVTGLSTSDTVVVNKTSHTAGCGIVNARVSAANTLALTFMNVLPALTCDPPSETYNIVAIRS